jgi:lactoylglutathione lyase
MRLTYVIKFVADMDQAVAFYRDKLGLQLKFQSDEWSEFVTGDTTLALHVASERNPAGACQLGFAAHDLEGIYARRDALGLDFTSSPTPQHGVKIAKLRDPDGSEFSVSADR